MTSEILVILDENAWIWSFLQDALKTANLPFIRLNSRDSLRGSWDRFSKLPYLIVHWESQQRGGGAIVEEILDLDPLFDPEDQVIALVTAPLHEDVIYFSELKIQKIIALRQIDTVLQKAKNDLLASLKPSIKPKHAQLWRQIGQLIQKPKDGAQIEELVKSWLNETPDPDSARSWDLQGCLAEILGDDKKADECWQKAIEKNPNYLKTYQSLSRYHERNGDGKKALFFLQKLYERNKNHIGRLVDIGKIHRQLGQDEHARRWFTMTLEKDPHCSRALSGLAELEFADGNLDAAKTLLAQSGRFAEVAAKLNQQGIDLVKQQKYQEALNHYQKAQEILPQQEKSPMLFYNIALCYWRWGQQVKAEEYLKLALIKDPEYTKAQRLIEHLKNS